MALLISGLHATTPYSIPWHITPFDLLGVTREGSGENSWTPMSQIMCLHRPHGQHQELSAQCTQVPPTHPPTEHRTCLHEPACMHAAVQPCMHARSRTSVQRWWASGWARLRRGAQLCMRAARLRDTYTRRSVRTTMLGSAPSALCWQRR